MKNDAQPGDTVELKIKDGGFFDSETNFKIVNDQQVKLGETIGTRTQAALVSGGLLVVSAEKKKADESDLPKDLPGRKQFVAAGLNFDQVKNIREEELDKLKFDTKTKESLLQYFIKLAKKTTEK